MEAYLHKPHKVKLFKDLKYNYSKFRQSLLQSNEIEDLHRVFDTMKKKLQIQQRQVVTSISHSHPEQLQKADISIQQKLIQYKKQKYEKRINHKMNVYKRKKQKKRLQVYKTPMKKLITKFQQCEKIDEGSSYVHDLKQSQKQLVYVKTNTSRRRSLVTTNPSGPLERNKIISIMTGLPIESRTRYQPIEQRMKSYKPTQQVKSEQTIDELQKSLSKIYTLDTQKFEKHDKYAYNEHQSAAVIQKIREKKLFEKAKSNFSKSIKTSQKMVDVVCRYLTAKKEKKRDYDNTIMNWKLDRPMTSHLRRQNYSMVGEKNQKEIQQYRQLTQKKRENIVQNNNVFYNDLIDDIIKQTKPGEEIPFTKEICQGLKGMLELHNRITNDDLNDLVKRLNSNGIIKDRLGQYTILRIEGFISDNLQLFLSF